MSYNPNKHTLFSIIFKNVTNIRICSKYLIFAKDYEKENK